MHLGFDSTIKLILCYSGFPIIIYYNLKPVDRVIRVN